MLEATTQLAQTHGRTLAALAQHLMQRETKTETQQEVFGPMTQHCSQIEQTSTSHSLLVTEVIQHSNFLEKNATQLDAHLQLNRDGGQIILGFSAHTRRGTTAEMLDWFLASTRMEILAVAFCTMTLTCNVFPFLAVLVFL